MRIPTAPDRPRVAGVVLAAGASERMGSPKALLRLDGRTYLDTILDTFGRAGLEPIVTVLGCDARRIAARTTWDGTAHVLNDAWRDGMHGSLQAGLRYLLAREPTRTGRDRRAGGAIEDGAGAPGAAGRPDTARIEAAVMALVDIPRFAATTVGRLIDAWRREPAPVAAPTHAGRHGHPVLWARPIWDEVLASDGAGGPRAIVERHRHELLEVVVDDPWILRDADTPDQHRRLHDAR